METIRCNPNVPSEYALHEHLLSALEVGVLKEIERKESDDGLKLEVAYGIRGERPIMLSYRRRKDKEGRIVEAVWVYNDGLDWPSWVWGVIASNTGGTYKAP